MDVSSVLVVVSLRNLARAGIVPGAYVQIGPARRARIMRHAGETMSRALLTVAALLAPLLGVATAARSAEPAAMLDGFWRTFFARPSAGHDPRRERRADQRI